LLEPHDPERLYSKINLVKALYRLGYNKEEVRQLFNLIDWLIKLPEELDQTFITEIHKFEQELKMPYINSVERFKIREATLQGKLEGRLEGKLEGKQEGLLEGIKKGLQKGRRQGLEKGLQQGALQGQIAGTKKSIRTILTTKFQFLPEAIIEQIEIIADPNQLDSLLIQAVQAGSLEELETLLANSGAVKETE
jgi:flagellar biosynthesis/type III secretory pathway protein FliH